MGSEKSLPAATAQVCLNPSRRIHGTRAFSGSGGSLRICANSSLETRGFDSGLRYTASHRSSQTNPSEPVAMRSEEHTSELQSRLHLVCRLLLEKKKKQEHHTH